MRLCFGPLGLLIVVAAGCGGGGGAGPVESSVDPRHNVLVIDDGFDPTTSEFAGRVAAYYSISCEPAAALEPVDDAGVPTPVPVDGGADDGGADDGGAGSPTLEERRRSLVMALQVRDTRCHLVPGVDPK